MKLAGPVLYGIMEEEECVYFHAGMFRGSISGKEIFKPRSEAAEGDSHTKTETHTHSYSKEMEISQSKMDILCFSFMILTSSIVNSLQKAPFHHYKIGWFPTTSLLSPLLTSLHDS